MPRGSRPGERRGGRKKGIPNKKTALRNAALNAAAADPNFSPLDYLLNVMGEQAFPLETRVAAAREALPYFHSKLLASTERQATPGRYGDAFRGDKGGSAGQRSIHVRILKGGSEGAANGGDADTPRDKSGSNASAKHRSPHAVGTARDGTLTPLQFLLDVMRAPNTPAHFRLRIAAVVAPYVHFKRAADGPPRIVVEDPTGFSIDPARALELRDAKDRYDVVYMKRISQPEPGEREADLEARIAEIQQGLQCPCPSRYTEEHRYRDQERLKALRGVRYSGLKVSMQEDMEEAWLMARVDSWLTTPEAAARERLTALADRRWEKPTFLDKRPLSLQEQAEFRALRVTYPDLPLEPRIASRVRMYKESTVRDAFAKYPPADGATDSVNHR
jgi:hypothetical protein